MPTTHADDTSSFPPLSPNSDSTPMNEKFDTTDADADLDKLEDNHSQADSSPPHPPTTWIGLPPSTVLFILCIMMHAVFVVGCFTLIIMHFHLKNGTVSVSSDKLHGFRLRLFYYITISPNTIMKVYLVPVLYITQKLAFRRYVHIEQSITSIHDKSTAWLGLGATIPVLWHYFITYYDKEKRTREDWPPFRGVVLISIYLICGLLLGIIAPDLTTVNESVGDTESFQNITLNLQNIGEADIQEAFPIVSILPLLDYSGDVFTSGLWHNLVFDVPNFELTGYIKVSATVFVVRCGQVPGASQISSDDGSFIIHVDDQLQDVVINPSSSRVLNVRPALWRDTSNQSPPPPTVIVASTFPIQDYLNNSNAAQLNLIPTTTPERCPTSATCGPVSQIQIIACNVASYDFGHGHQDFEEISLNIDGFPFTPSILTESSNDTWVIWSLPDPPTEEQSLLDLIGNFSQQSPTSRTTLFSSVDGSTVSSYTLSALEDTLMETSGYYNPSIAYLTLSGLEEILGDAIAAVFWRAAVRQVDISTPPSPVYYTPTYDVQIGRWAPINGLAVSTTMLVVAIILTRQPKATKEEKLDTLGPLQLTWYFSRLSKSDGLSDFAREQNPTTDRLRKRGKKTLYVFADGN